MKFVACFWLSAPAESPRSVFDMLLEKNGNHRRFFLATYAINKFALKNDLKPNDLLQKVGVIVAADFIAEYIDDYMNNRPLSFLK